ncbi:MAG: hypothetical protein ACFFA3_19145 [Promethearchaeota archaeon]
MPNCIDCGAEIYYLDNSQTEFRCPSCEYQKNLKKATHIALKYCGITMGIIFIGCYIITGVIMLLYKYGFRL